MRVVLFAAIAAIVGRSAAGLMHLLGKVPQTASHTARDGKDVEETQAPLNAAVMRTQTLNNVEDIAYTITISLGGQELEAILDSGSFELVVLSEDCMSCGTSRFHLYNRNISHTYQMGSTRSICTYGSGQASTEESYDTVSVGGLQASQQFFWSVYDVDERFRELLEGDYFSAVCGLGPTKSASAFATHELGSILKEVEDYTRLGVDLSPSIAKIVDSFEAKVELAMKYDTMMDNLHISDTSVCFGRESRSPGFVVWNDISSKKSPELFVEVPVVGDYYWSAVLTDVRFGGVRLDVEDQWKLPQYELDSIGCHQKTCSALLDTGTSIISAPYSTVYLVDKILFAWERAGGDCEDLSSLPNLEFGLGGKTFSLPPESYVATFVGSDASLRQMQNLLPHLYTKHFSRRVNGSEPASQVYSYCASAISPVDESSEWGPLCIFGIPFFREYYTTFHESNGSATSMSFSKAGATCKPAGNPSTQIRSMVAEVPRRRKAQLRLDVSKIRTSSILDRVWRLNGPKLPALADLRREPFGPHRGSAIVRI